MEKKLVERQVKLLQKLLGNANNALWLYEARMKKAKSGSGAFVKAQHNYSVVKKRSTDLRQLLDRLLRDAKKIEYGSVKPRKHAVKKKKAKQKLKPKGKASEKKKRKK